MTQPADPESPIPPDVYRIAQAQLRIAQRERDEARADAASYAARLKATDISWTAVARERDEARAEVERLKAAYERAVDARLADAFDRLRDKAKLIKEFGPQFGAFLARERNAAPVNDDVLRLPEVPEGTVALVDRNGQRWVPSKSTVPSERGWFLAAHSNYLAYSELLAKCGPLTVELAPPREPRTVAEIWRSMTQTEREHVAEIPRYAELAEALDRAAGPAS